MLLGRPLSDTPLSWVPEPAASGTYTVTPARIGSTATVASPTVARTALAAVTPSRLDSTAAVRNPVVAAAGLGSVSASRIEPTAAVAAPTLTRSAVYGISPGRVDSSAAFGVPTVSSSGTAQIVVGRIASSAVVPRPVVVRTGPVVTPVKTLPTWYYTPGALPMNAEPWLVNELRRISQATYGAAPYIQLQVQYKEPSKPRDGMCLLADGTSWDPGSGAGVYARISDAWVKL